MTRSVSPTPTLSRGCMDPPLPALDPAFPRAEARFPTDTWITNGQSRFVSLASPTSKL